MRVPFIYDDVAYRDYLEERVEPPSRSDPEFSFGELPREAGVRSRLSSPGRWATSHVSGPTWRCSWSSPALDEGEPPPLAVA